MAKKKRAKKMPAESAGTIQGLSFRKEPAKKKKKREKRTPQHVGFSEQKYNPGFTVAFVGYHRVRVPHENSNFGQDRTHWASVRRV